MATTDSSNRKEMFARAFRDFVDAHGRGMRSIKARDFRALQDAVADERAAVETASALIDDALSASPARAGGEPHHVSSGAGRSSLEADHTRLFREMQALQREHHALETQGGDLAAHREHRARLEVHIGELKTHLERLRAQDRKWPE